MKKNIKFILVAIMAMMVGNNMSAAEDVIMKAGIYIFDFKGCNPKAWGVNLFNDASNAKYSNNSNYAPDTEIVLYSSAGSCNDNVNRSNYREYSSKDGANAQEFIIIEVKADGYKYTTDWKFIQCETGTSGSKSWNTGWKEYTAPTKHSTGGGKDYYYCEVTWNGSTFGYDWRTSAEKSLPACLSSLPVLSYTAGPHGSVLESTGTISSGEGVTANTSVTLTATPESASYVFAYWTDANSDIVSHSAIYTFKMPASNYSLTAHFTAAGSDPTISGCGDCFLVAP